MAAPQSLSYSVLNVLGDFLDTIVALLRSSLLCKLCMWPLDEPDCQEGEQHSDRYSALENKAFSDVLSRINSLPCFPHTTSLASVMAHLKWTIPFSLCVRGPYRQ